MPPKGLFKLVDGCENSEFEGVVEVDAPNGEVDEDEKRDEDPEAGLFCEPKRDAEEFPEPNAFTDEVLPNCCPVVGVNEEGPRLEKRAPELVLKGLEVLLDPKGEVDVDVPNAPI